MVPKTACIILQVDLPESRAKIIIPSKLKERLYIIIIIIVISIIIIIIFIILIILIYSYIYIYIHYHSNIQISSNERSSPCRPDEPGRSPGNAPPSARRSPRSGDRGDRTGAGAAAPLGAQRWRKDDRKPRIAIAGHSRTCIHIIFLYVSIIDIYIYNIYI